MVDKIKQGKPLWGVSELNEHQQGVAHRNSRYTGVFLHVLPMFNFVNHPYVSHTCVIQRPGDADQHAARCRYGKVLPTSRAGTRGRATSKGCRMEGRLILCCIISHIPMVYKQCFRIIPNSFTDSPTSDSYPSQQTPSSPPSDPDSQKGHEKPSSQTPPPPSIPAPDSYPQPPSPP